MISICRSDKARDLATARGSPLHDLGYAGHINIASGYGRWPAGYAPAARLADCRSPATA
ncbi:alpha/beta hydrolase [Devosia sp. A8/3-2]|nr:alpha/beta hydrolase [Devosia sp. A8/3-2]